MSGIAIDPVALLRPRRKIEGISAVLLPFAADGGVDWDAFAAHVARTADAGLTQALEFAKSHDAIYLPGWCGPAED